MKLVYCFGLLLGSLAAMSIAVADERPPGDAKQLVDVAAGLEKSGYGPIVEISFDDSMWEVEAYRGNKAFELNVDPKTGKVASEHPDDGDAKPPADALALSEIIGAVKEAGFANVADISFEGRSWEIEATRDNKKRELHVDPSSGKVISDRADD